MNDVTVLPNALTREACYQRVADSTLVHQLRLTFTVGRHKVVGICNCGARLTPRSPQEPGSLERTKAEYSAHVEAALAASS